MASRCSSCRSGNAFLVARPPLGRLQQIPPLESVVHPCLLLRCGPCSSILPNSLEEHIELVWTLDVDGVAGVLPDNHYRCGLDQEGERTVRAAGRYSRSDLGMSSCRICELHGSTRSSSSPVNMHCARQAIVSDVSGRIDDESQPTILGTMSFSRARSFLDM